LNNNCENASVFFFQAEDGIRDRNVTGVQTCALPICDSPGPSKGCASASEEDHEGWGGPVVAIKKDHVQKYCDNNPEGSADRHSRSEERRVGKEWRTRRTR